MLNKNFLRDPLIIPLGKTLLVTLVLGGLAVGLKFGFKEINKIYDVPNRVQATEQVVNKNRQFYDGDLSSSSNSQYNLIKCWAIIIPDRINCSNGDEYRTEKNEKGIYESKLLNPYHQ